MNYKLVLDLCRDSYFVRHVQMFHEDNLINNIITKDSWYEFIIKNVKVNNYILSDVVHFKIYKEIMYAKDLVVHFNLDLNFKLSKRDNRDYSTRSWSIVRDDKTINRILGYVREYPRATANDVYVRDYKAEERASEDRWACCLPYDCMHHENDEWYNIQIWTKQEELEDMLV